MSIYWIKNAKGGAGKTGVIDLPRMYLYFFGVKISISLINSIKLFYTINLENNFEK